MQRLGHLRRAFASLPTGGTLDRASWSRRHTAICRLLWAHVVLVPLYGITQGHGVVHVLSESALLLGGLAVAAGATRLGPTTRAVVATVGLTVASALLVHASGGLIEMHFHFFLVVVVVSLYQSWRPFLAALVVVVLHHGILGVLDPTAVYNHPDAIAAPWPWATLHAAFIAVVSAACLVAWRLNEDALQGERGAQRALTRVRDDLAAAQELAGVGSWDWDLQTDRVTWSDELYRIVGTDQGTAPTLQALMDAIHPEDLPRVEQLLRTAIQTGESLDYQCRIVGLDGTERTIRALNGFEIDDRGQRVRMIGVCQDVTAWRSLQEEIEHRAFYDGLTGLANRALFLDRLDHALAGRARSGTSLCVLYLDLDGFKAVNDRLGHRAGDELLIEVGHRLEQVVRASDTVARFGGDEFAILLEATSTLQARETADRIAASLVDPVVAGHRELRAAISIGIAATDHAVTADQLLQHADLAMYVAKHRVAGACWELFHADLADVARDDALLAVELGEAIADGQLRVHYQPIVDLHTESIVAVEALVRWQHPERGLLSPAEFIRVAEESGQIVALGAWVTAAATREVAALQLALGHRVRVSVNLAAPQLDSDVVAMVEEALAAAAMDPCDLTLEITETSLMSQQVQAVGKLETLRRSGVRIAIDDFGTGYSSLEYLKRLPVDTLKIDRAFVGPVAEGVEDSALAHAIIKLADIFGLCTIAEGVETPEQAHTLRALGCALGQGYLYSRPVPAGVLAADARWAAPRPLVRQTATF